MGGRFAPESGAFLPVIPAESGRFRPESLPSRVAGYDRNRWQVWTGIFIPQEEIRLPHYLPPSLEQKLALLSKTSGKSRDALINMVLENELDLLLTVAN